MTSEPAPTICAKCRWHKFKGKAWYHDRLCTHPNHELQPRFDVVTGNMVYPQDNRYPKCCDVNTGDCKFWWEKLPWWRWQR